MILSGGLLFVSLLWRTWRRVPLRWQTVLRQFQGVSCCGGSRPDPPTLPRSDWFMRSPSSIREASHVRLWLVWQMYSFTCFSMRLNELHQEMVGTIPQTDCRLRPDIRAMENGDIGKSRWWYRHRTGCWVSTMFAVLIDLASQEKKRLEEKQRTARKSLSKSGEEWKTR